MQLLLKWLHAFVSWIKAWCEQHLEKKEESKKPVEQNEIKNELVVIEQDGVNSPPNDFVNFNQDMKITNNVNEYKQFFRDHRQTLANSNKPLCIYAISKKHDHNGAIISNKALIRVKHEITEYSKHYTVVPIFFENKDDLERKILKHKNTYNKDVSLLYLAGHGDTTYFQDLHTWMNTKIQHITPKKTQIILDACLTAGGNVKNSIAHKIAKDNDCEVFGATESIGRTQPIFKTKNGEVKVMYLGASYNGKLVKSYKIKPSSSQSIFSQP